MTLLGSVDIPFTKSTKIAVDATDTAGQAATVAQKAADTAGEAKSTAESANQTATQAEATAEDAAQAAQIAITTANGKNKAYYGSTTPTNPKPGDIWFVEDDNNNVIAIKHYDGTQWITDVDNTELEQQISAAQAAADNAVTVGQTAQQVAQQAAQVGDSAAKTAEAAQQAANAAQTDVANAVTQANKAVDTANTAANDAQSALAAADAAVDTANTAKQVASDAATQSSNAWTKAQDAMTEAQKKADATSVYTKTDIDNALKGYATTTTVNTLTGRVDSAETAIQQNTKAITLKADQSTVNTLTGRISTAEATLKTQANEISARITKTDADAKYATQTALTATANSLTSTITSFKNASLIDRGSLNTATDWNSIKTVGIYRTAFSNAFPPNFPKGAYGFGILVVEKSGDTVVQTFKPHNGGQLSYYRQSWNGTDAQWTSWSQSETTSGSQAKANAVKEYATSQISQLSDNINLRVKKGDVINQINVSTEGILIDGKKVHITGQTTIDNAVIKDAMIDSMTANKLTAGTIDANVITVKNINASNIVTGTLDASKATVANIDASKITTGTLNAARIAAGSIDASKLNVSSLSALSANLGNVTAGNISGVNINIGNGNFTVDTAGNLVAKNANITGVINATSGRFSGVLEGATGTFKGDLLSGYLVIGQDSPNFGSYEDGVNAIEIKNPVRVTDGVFKWGESFFIKTGNDTIQFENLPVYFNTYVYISDNLGVNGVVTAGNIQLNSNHSIISRDGGQLYFTNSGGSRIDVTVRQVHADQWIMPNNMAVGYHTIACLDSGKLWFTDNTSNGKRIDIAIAGLDYTGSLRKSSSEAIKANIEPIDFSALDEIMKTDFYSYNYISDLERGVTKPSFGPVIGDSYRLSDKFLTQDEKSISIDSMTAINSQAIKELYESMQKQNQQIVLKIADLEARLAKLEE